MEQNYISENCDVPTKHDYCSIPLPLEKVLANSKSTDLKSQYEKSFSLKEGNRYINNTIMKSAITECLNSKYGVVIRKFEGNRETKLIYTPAHRNNYWRI